MVEGALLDEWFNLHEQIGFYWFTREKVQREKGTFFIYLEPESLASPSQVIVGSLKVKQNKT